MFSCTRVMWLLMWIIRITGMVLIPLAVVRPLMVMRRIRRVTYSRVFEVASGENYGADVHVAFAAFTALGAGFAAGTDHFNAKVYGSPLGNLEVKLIGTGTDSVATIDLATYAGSIDEGNGWYSVSIPFTDFSNPDQVDLHSGYLIGPRGGSDGCTVQLLLYGCGVEYGCTVCSPD